MGHGYIVLFCFAYPKPTRSFLLCFHPKPSFFDARGLCSMGCTTTNLEAIFKLHHA